ncbi:uncharacterized protein LAESUDRAFT_654232 [Laetiporus sulphureus 93-53]|uniref:MARVEL domain-containing protein n=1 Tax=Laetiporus sulphureus 93-53 TaxID=1314785 RepID=A0A165E0R7_9APHY|nr:uncharacterized protein LAESUDRAFT_654232 [Laetiporus sulphureus 93-53]KZT06022.1 hypothetical protein LAESUDRAFT_654232 [Laetiporus sulphureus 93-53]
MASTVDTAGFLVLLLFIPLLSICCIWMIVHKPAIIFHASQAFFNFLAMCCFASVAAFQARWHVGPSGLTGFALFVSVTGVVFPLFLLFVPVIYEKFDKGARLARALSETRVAFILISAGTTFSLLIAFITTISAWTEPGCKNASNDPHESLGSTFRSELSGWCSTKKAGAVFFWLAFAFWLASLGLTIYDWRNGRSMRPRDQPFTHPTEFSEVATTAEGDGDYDDQESQYSKPIAQSNASQTTFDTAYVPPALPTPAQPAASYAAPVPSRPSMDVYGAFSDPTPTGFGSAASTPSSPTSDMPRVSRTMQYADPYAAVRATLAAGQQPAAHSGPPSYSYGGYS